MNMDDLEIDKHVFEMIEDFRDGKLDPERLGSFRKLLTENAKARRSYLEHNGLSELIASKYVLETTHPNGISVTSTASPRIEPARREISLGGIPKAAWTFLAIAASLLIVVGVFSWQSQNANPIAKIDVNQPVHRHRPVLKHQAALRPQSSDLPIAVLLGGPQAQWKSARMAGALGVPLREGWVELVSGNASVRFNSGAVATLIGPARFHLIDSMQCFLDSGSMVANVPEQAHGFQVHTKAMELTDLGTEFGVRVGGSDATEVHVIDGLVEVKCETTDDSSETETFAMRKNEAKTFSSKVLPADVPVDLEFASKIVSGRSSQTIGYYTFASTQLGDSWTTNPSATTVGSSDVEFHDFTYLGVQPGPAEFPRNLNRWSFKRWQPQYRAQQNYVGFKVSADSGKVIQLKNLGLELFRAGGEKLPDMAPQDGVVRISSDGFQTFTRYVLLDNENYVNKPKLISIDVGKIKPAKEYEFRFLFKGQSMARAIRLDEVTLEVDVVPANFSE